MTDEGLLTTTYYRDSNASDSLPATTAVCFSTPPPGYQKTPPPHPSQNSVHHPASSASSIAGIAIGVVVAVLIFILALVIIIAVIIALILIMRKKSAKKEQVQILGDVASQMSSLSHSQRSQIEMNSMSGQSSSTRSVSIKMDSSKFTINPKDLEYLKKLAQGTFGVVYYGLWRKQEVAIKTLKFSDVVDEMSEQELQKNMIELENEITVLSELRHRNIVLFMGYCISPPEYSIVTEFVKGGSLYAFFKQANRPALGWLEKVDLMMQVSSAMQFLHAQGVIHRDMKSHNILLDGVVPSAITPKVCDFGLAKTRVATEAARTKMTQAVGTPLWMSPEVANGSSYGNECDIYSFAIIMWEVLFEKIPYSDLPSVATVHVHVRVANDPNFRPTIPPEYENATNGIKAYIDLMKQCWSHEPKSRPPFIEITPTLAEIKSLPSE